MLPLTIYLYIRLLLSAHKWSFRINEANRELVAEFECEVLHLIEV